MIRDVLTAGWESPYALRALDRGALSDLHPLSELEHPIIRKATECIGMSEGEDHHRGPIGCSTRLVLLEIRADPWRGGVWRDPETGVHWLIAAGLAKGEHKDNDDFYEILARADKNEATLKWLPTPTDVRLLKQETAARLLTEWELRIQRDLCDALTRVQDGGHTRIAVGHPVIDQDAIGTVILEVTPVREDNYAADEVTIEFQTQDRYLGSALEWKLILRTLISISPPEQGWDRLGQEFTNIAEPGAWKGRVAALTEYVTTGALALSEPGTHAHYSHAPHLAGSTIEGTGVRALCGVFFVPRQDHDALPRCPHCAAQFDQLPSA